MKPERVTFFNIHIISFVYFVWTTQSEADDSFKKNNPQAKDKLERGRERGRQLEEFLPLNFCTVKPLLSAATLGEMESGCSIGVKTIENLHRDDQKVAAVGQRVDRLIGVLFIVFN